MLLGVRGQVDQGVLECGENCVACVVLCCVQLYVREREREREREIVLVVFFYSFM